MCCLAVLLCGYYYIEKELTVAENSIESVPYYSYPEKKGILFNICGEKTLIHLDFEGALLSVVFADEFEPTDELYGYSIDYNITGDYSLVGEIVDLVGGIEITAEETTLSYTGVQIKELLETTPQNLALRRNIIESITQKISKNGFSKEDFMRIIELSQTNLTFPDCYYWSQYISDVCKMVRFVN